MVQTLITTPEAWALLGIVLFGLGTFFDGFYLGATGIGALLTGAALWLDVPHVEAWGMPFLACGIGTVLSCFVLRRLYGTRTEDDPNDAPYRDDH